MRSRWLPRLAVLALLVATGCTGDPIPGDGQGGAGLDGSGGFSGSSGGAGGAGAGGGAEGGQGGQGGQGGGVSDLDALLEALRADLDGTLLGQSRAAGWPAPVPGGRLVVSADPALTLVAGDHDGWTGTATTADLGFSWVVLELAPGSRYKLTDSATWEADPWSRAYGHDENGIMSMVAPAAAHLERHFQVQGLGLGPRTVRVYLPAEAATHVLYAHDGQNLFDPTAPWGGWELAQSLPPAMMVVAIDNTAARMDEYTHVPDDLGSGPLGGLGDAYADLLQQVIRPLVADHYGEPSTVGLLGSSLGGLISLHVADRHPGSYDFAASLSGTVGWGSIHPAVHEETVIERYAAHGHQSTPLYVDSGGGGSCVDSDGDGIEDDALDGEDNYCENKQLESTLLGLGYVSDADLWHWWEPGAAHDEAAWASRVWRPLQIFAAL